VRTDLRTRFLATGETVRHAWHKMGPPLCVKSGQDARDETVETGLSCLITQRSQVQILPPLQKKAQVTGPVRFAGQGL